MPLRAPPPDFRHVWLLPGPTAATVAIGVTAVSLGTFGVSFVGLGHALPALTFAFLGGALATLSMAWDGTTDGLLGRDAGPPVRQIAMAIVPWGILLTPEAETRVLRWPAIRSISVQASHTLRGGTPAVVASVVHVRTEREVFGGRTPGSVGLEGLTVNLESYAAEAARPVASDLAGLACCGDGVTDPVMEDLLHAADELCTTAHGAAALHLPPGGYRQVSNRGVGPETLALLRAALTDGAESPADPRPLAAIVAALLGAEALLPDLLRITVSPHPVVAAVARAAALRLGAPRTRAGSIDEVSDFLFAEDCAQIARWAEGAA